MSESLPAEESSQRRHDLELKARLLAASAVRADRQEAIDIFQQLRSFGPLSTDDSILLAQLHTTLQDAKAAAEEARHLVSMAPRNPRVLSIAISLMLPVEGNDELLADSVSQLKSLGPQDVESSVLSARWLIRQGKTIEALALLTQLESSGTDASEQSLSQQQMLRLATAADEIARDFDRRGQLSTAEEFAGLAERVYAMAVDDDPRLRLHLIDFLIGRWRTDEAVELCRSLQGVVASEPLAQTYVQVLRSRQVNAADGAELTAWVEQQCDAQPDSVVLRLCHGHLLSLIGDYPGAGESYRIVLQLDPTNVEALNEVAFLQVLLGGDADEAAALIARAIEQTGPVGVLVDTRARIELAQGLTREAVQSAEAAISDSPSPVRYFRLAQAQFASGKSKPAKESLRTAFMRGLDKSILHPLEVAAFQQLRSDLDL